MSKRFDAATKYLVESRPGDWLPYVGLPPAEVDVVEADLSTVSLEADKILRIRAAFPWLAHFEFQTSHDPALIERILQYNVLLRARHKLPVQSVLILLTPEADRGSITGTLQHRLPDSRVYLEFRYEVVRVWLKPVEEVLAGGLGTLPLAPMSDVTPEQLPGVIRRMEERLRREATPEESGIIWTATNVLMGLRYPKEFSQQLLQGVMNMKESVTYQAIVEEGRMAEAQRLLLRQGAIRFGTPTEQIQNQVTSLTALDRLETLSDRILSAESWDELLRDA